MSKVGIAWRTANVVKTANARRIYPEQCARNTRYGVGENEREMENEMKHGIFWLIGFLIVGLIITSFFGSGFSIFPRIPRKAEFNFNDPNLSANLDKEFKEIEERQKEIVENYINEHFSEPKFNSEKLNELQSLIPPTVGNTAEFIPPTQSIVSTSDELTMDTIVQPKTSIPLDKKEE